MGSDDEPVRIELLADTAALARAALDRAPTWSDAPVVAVADIVRGLGAALAGIAPDEQQRTALVQAARLRHYEGRLPPEPRRARVGRLTVEWIWADHYQITIAPPDVATQDASSSRRSYSTSLGETDAVIDLDSSGEASGIEIMFRTPPSLELPNEWGGVSLNLRFDRANASEFSAWVLRVDDVRTLGEPAEVEAIHSLCDALAQALSPA